MALRAAEVTRPEIDSAPNGHHPRPHHDPDCPIAIVMERERLKFVWGVERLGDRFEYLPHNRDFWRVWGPKHMPECTCQPQIVGVIVELRPMAGNGNGHKNGHFRLHFQQRVSAPIYSQLRDRLSVWAYKTTGKLDLVDADIETLAPMAGRTSKQVLNTLLAFETKRHPSSSSSRGAPDAARSAK
jgi:hypothetical protein